VQCARTTRGESAAAMVPREIRGQVTSGHRHETAGSALSACVCGRTDFVTLSAFDGAEPQRMCRECRKSWRALVLSELVPEHGCPLLVGGVFVTAAELRDTLLERAGL
jgi:hypothetical protein